MAYYPPTTELDFALADRDAAADALVREAGAAIDDSTSVQQLRKEWRAALAKLDEVANEAMRAHVRLASRDVSFAERHGGRFSTTFAFLANIGPMSLIFRAIKLDADTGDASPEEDDQTRPPVTTPEATTKTTRTRR